MKPITSNPKKVIYLFTKIAQKDEDGKVKTAPRNFVTTGVKKGHIDKALFSKPGYISQGNLWNYFRPLY